MNYMISYHERLEIDLFDKDFNFMIYNGMVQITFNKKISRDAR